MKKYIADSRAIICLDGIRIVAKSDADPSGWRYAANYLWISYEDRADDINYGEDAEARDAMFDRISDYLTAPVLVSIT